MQQFNNKNSGTAQIQPVIITAITLLALAGAILGFSLGALTHHSTSGTPTPNSANTNTNKNPQPTKTSASPTPVASPTTPAQRLGGPMMAVSTSLTGTYKYTFTAQAVYNGTSTPVKSNGITCRLWITKSDPSKLNTSSFKVISNLQQTVPDEIAGGLEFDSATPQTQPCNNGLGTWNTNLSSSLSKGNYYVVGLTDWNGTFYNWSWSVVAQV